MNVFSTNSKFIIDYQGISIPKPISITVNSFENEDVNDFREKLEMAVDFDQEYIPIYINSGGGLVCGLFAMLDMMKTIKKPMLTIATGTCMSAATVLLSAGTPGYRYAGELTQFMFHEPSGEITGKAEEIITYSNFIEKLQEKYDKILDKNCNKKPGTFKKFFKDGKNLDLFLSSNEALNLGVIDHIGIPEISFEFTCKVNITNKSI